MIRYLFFVLILLGSIGCNNKLQPDTSAAPKDDKESDVESLDRHLKSLEKVQGISGVCHFCLFQRQYIFQ